MLKLLACLFMLLDHVGYVFADRIPISLYYALRAVGRLAFPIFVWQIARGYDRTRNRNFYFMRLFVFAVASEVILRFGYRIANLPVPGTNVLFTFSIALATYAALDLLASAFCMLRFTPIDCSVNLKPAAIFGRRVSPVIAFFTGFSLTAGIILITGLIHPDYEFYGLGSAVVFRLVNKHFPKESRLWPDIIAFSLVNISYVLYYVLFLGYSNGGPALLQSLSILALPLCHLLEREHRPSTAARYAFYAFYPLHFLILCLIRSAI